MIDKSQCNQYRYPVQTIQNEQSVPIFDLKAVTAHHEQVGIKSSEICSSTTPSENKAINSRKIASSVTSKTETQTLPGKSDQFMQWVIFNDECNSKKLVKDLPILGQKEMKQLNCIIDQLNHDYPMDTPTLHLVFEIFQPELLDSDQIEAIGDFFGDLEKKHSKLHVYDYADLNKNLVNNESLCKLKSYFSWIEMQGTRQKFELVNRVVTAIGHSDGRFSSVYGDDSRSVWTNIVAKNPWMQIFNGSQLSMIFDLANKNISILVSNALQQQINQLNKEQLDKLDFLAQPLPLSGGQKAIYVDLQRCIVLFNSDKLSGVDGNLIYRDFDTTMTARLPDIPLKPEEILGVPDWVTFPGDPCGLYVLPQKIVENAVMGVTQSGNTHLEQIIKDVSTKINSLYESDSVSNDQAFADNYNYIFDKLNAALVANEKSTFEHHKSGTLKK
ncbi:hypothetical protein [Endozoicomonas sp. SCSIO W0465]|uniref:hypothetical protein n=1 Tax=Endozoicomonas sp. SCSIO W0465 TaxID=2918516 RepID=UPI002074EDED|nr:hypothetical protein [Endozoicomonas sp. SCSIO W0465]USE36232.1 hypothetical protein MJO57_30055 [Endozoicomonas sp. SCSIO W0465]